MSASRHEVAFRHDSFASYPPVRFLFLVLNSVLVKLTCVHTTDLDSSCSSHHLFLKFSSKTSHDPAVSFISVYEPYTQSFSLCLRAHVSCQPIVQKQTCLPTTLPLICHPPPPPSPVPPAIYILLSYTLWPCLHVSLRLTASIPSPLFSIQSRVFLYPPKRYFSLCFLEGALSCLQSRPDMSLHPLTPPPCHTFTVPS